MARDIRAFNNAAVLRGDGAPVRLSVLDQFAADNARRVPCAQCDMSVLPEGMARHIDIHHTDD